MIKYSMPFCLTLIVGSLLPGCVSMNTPPPELTVAIPTSLGSEPDDLDPNQPIDLIRCWAR
jgi:hypothetical protein